MAPRAQGRVELNGSFDCCQSMFGLHTVNSFTKPSGPLAIADVEAVFEKKLGNLSAMVDVMDFNAGLFTTDLAPWLHSFRRDGVKFHAVAWTSVDNLAAVSVLVSIPGTSVVLELCSTSIPASVNYTLLEQVPSRFGSRLSEIRPTSSGSESVNASNASTAKALELLIPIWVSRASSNVTRDVDFYKKLLGASVVHEGSHESPTGAVKFAYLTLQTSPKIFEIHFVERPADPTGGMTIADLEGYYKAVHASAVRSPYCGQDVWFDNQ